MPNRRSRNKKLKRQKSRSSERSDPSSLSTFHQQRIHRNRNQNQNRHGHQQQEQQQQDTFFQTSIEEDLKQQRLMQQQKRQEQEQEEKQRQEKQGIDITDDDDDDEEERYFQPVPVSPQHLIMKSNWPITDQIRFLRRHQHQHQYKTGTQNWSHHLHLLNVLQQSPMLVRKQRYQLSQIFHSKYLLQHITINQRASCLFDCYQSSTSTTSRSSSGRNKRKKSTTTTTTPTPTPTTKIKWSESTLPPGNLYCSCDMVSKYHLHPSARTMDVAMFDNDQNNTALNNHTNNGNDTSRNYDNDNDRSRSRFHHQRNNNFMKLPTVVTTVQGGWALLRPTQQRDQPYVNTLRSKPVHSIRIHSKSHRCGMIIQTWDQQQQQHSRNYHHHSSSPNKFRWYQLPSATRYAETDVYEPVHDFCFGTDLVLFACGRRRGQRHGNSNTSSSSSSLLTPIFVPLQDGGTFAPVHRLTVQNFPQSDTLCVEMACQDGAKFVSFGHRNGQVSLVDLRQPSTCCAIYQYDQYDQQHRHYTQSTSMSTSTSTRTTKSMESLGSATSIKFLQSAKQLLVKRSYGTCQLYDIRMSSSSSSSSSNFSSLSSSTSHSNYPSALLYHLQVPIGIGDDNDDFNLYSSHRNGKSNNNNNNNNGHDISSTATTTTTTTTTTKGKNDIHPTLSANCNGFAVDPIFEQTLISPYINMNRQACLGIWSLKTGIMVGHRVLLSSTSSPTSSSSPLSSSSSSLLSLSNGSNSMHYYHDDDDENVLHQYDDDNDATLYTEVCQQATPGISSSTSSSSSFGIWVKCGKISTSKRHIPKYGSLYHITLPGST